MGRDFGMTSEPTKAIKAVAVGRRYHIRCGGLQDLQYVGDVSATWCGAFEHCWLTWEHAVGTAVWWPAIPNKQGFSR